MARDDEGDAPISNRRHMLVLRRQRECMDDSCRSCVQHIHVAVGKHGCEAAQAESASTCELPEAFAAKMYYVPSFVLSANEEAIASQLKSKSAREMQM